MGRSISPMQEEIVVGSDPRAAPRLIVPMSLRLTIPRRVALQQSSLPLHQPDTILQQEHEICRAKNSERLLWFIPLVSREGFMLVSRGKATVHDSYLSAEGPSAAARGARKEFATPREAAIGQRRIFCRPIRGSVLFGGPCTQGLRPGLNSIAPSGATPRLLSARKEASGRMTATELRMVG